MKVFGQLPWAAAVSFFCLGSACWGSTIDAVSVDSSLTTPVQSVLSFQAQGNNMGPMLVGVKFGGAGDADSCSWDLFLSGCDGANGYFSIRVSGGNTYSATWSLTNTHPDGPGSVNGTLLWMTMDALAGSVAFDGCVNRSEVVQTDNSPCLEGTPNSDIGRFAESAGGGVNLAASAAYSNRINVGLNPGVGDLWGFLTLNFVSLSGEDEEESSHRLNQQSSAFTWRMDTDLVLGGGQGDPVSDIPEPATIVLAGGALLMLAGLRRR